MNEVDVFIIGAGPTGSIAAVKLVQSGFSVMVAEKVEFPRFVIGESLLPRCNELLENANMLECVKNAKFQFKGGAIFQNENGGYTELDFSNNLGQKWGSSFQVKREIFDKLLIDEAISKGAQVGFNLEVIDYDEVRNIVTTKDTNGAIKIHKAKKVLDASGYGRVLPRLLDLESESSLTKRCAVFCRVDKDIRPAGDVSGYIVIDVVKENEAWIWNIPFSDGVTSVGIVCSEEYFQNHGLTQNEFWDMIIQNHVHASKRYEKSKKTVEVGIVSDYSSAVKKMFGKNYILGGNASEFLDPVFSSGVTLALESGAKAAELIAEELNGREVDYKSEYEDYMMLGINVFRDYVNAWYDARLQTILFSNKKTDKITKKIISILSGYVWDRNNSFVTSSRLALQTTYEILKK